MLYALLFLLKFYVGRYESSIDVEIQQRAVEYFELSKKGAALMDVLAEMPKFPERQVCCFVSWCLSSLSGNFFLGFQ